MPGTILTTAPVRRHFDIPQALAWVKATHGKGKLRQLAEMAGLAARSAFAPKDYYLYGLFSPDLSADDRAAFLSIPQSNKLNARLSPKDALTQNGLLGDKLLAGLAMQALGLPMPRLLAHAAALVRITAPATLTTPGAIADFLRSPGALPCFGKPVHGSLGVGGAIFSALTPDGRNVILGDGREVAVDAVAAEVLHHFPEGYLFQELLQNAPDLAARFGPVLAILRVTTVQSRAGPQVLYVLLRIPGPGSMVDSTTGGRMMLGAVEPATGRLLQVQDMFRIGGRHVEAHPVTGSAMAGTLLQGVDEAIRLASTGHAAFAEHGVLGWDFGLTARGAVALEANTNPQHYLYQRAANRGVMNPALRPAIDAALAFAAARQAEARARQKAGF